MPPRTMTGGSALKKIKTAAVALHKFVKDHKIASRAFDHFGHPKLAAHARLAGYGRRRRRKRVAT